MSKHNNKTNIYYVENRNTVPRSYELVPKLKDSLTVVYSVTPECLNSLTLIEVCPNVYKFASPFNYYVQLPEVCDSPLKLVWPLKWIIGQYVKYAQQKDLEINNGLCKTINVILNLNVLSEVPVIFPGIYDPTIECPETQNRQNPKWDYSIVISLDGNGNVTNVSISWSTPFDGLFDTYYNVVPKDFSSITPDNYTIERTCKKGNAVYEVYTPARYISFDAGNKGGCYFWIATNLGVDNV